MAAKKKPIERVAGEPPADSRAAWTEPVAPARASGGVIVQDEPAAEAADRFVAWLKEHKLI